MFYSHDLLGRKSPLGAIWTMAHGKKLSKCKILGINVADVCKHILQPEVPHSLRLQGILIGGVVIVFNKQQIYLLEDLQEMLRKVKAASAPELTTVAAVNTVLQKGRHKARVEAITMADMGVEQMLVLPTDALDQIQDLDDLEFFVDPLRGRGPAAEPDGESTGDGKDKTGDVGGVGRGGASGMLADDLFMLPTLAPPSEHDGATQQGARQEHGASGRASGAANGQPSRGQHEIDPDELFEAPDLQMLMDDMEEGGTSDAFLRALGGFGAAEGPKAAGAGNKKAANKKGTRSHAAADATTGDTTGTDAAAAAGPAAALNGQALADDLFEMPADLMIVMEEDHNNDNNNDEGNQGRGLPGDNGDANAAQQPNQRAPHRRRRQRAALNEASGATAAEDEEDEDEEFQGAAAGMAGGIVQQQQGSLGARRSPSVVPFPSVGQPPEHFMPPSPVHDGEEGLFPPAAADGAPGIPPGGSHLAASEDTSARNATAAATANWLARGKRRRTSDEDNDSASEATHSLLAEEEAEAARVLEAAAGPRGAARGGEQQAGRIGGAAGQGRKQQAGGPKPKRRRTGARVTLDNLEETLVRGMTYREWTLDSSAIVACRRDGRGPARPPAAPAVTGPAAPAAQGQARQQQPQHQHRGFGALPPVVGASMNAAVVSALAACDADAAAAAVLHGPAALLGGMGMNWAPHLVHLVAVASAADGIEDDDDDDGATVAAEPARPKRQRATKAALKFEDPKSSGGGGLQPPQRQRQQSREALSGSTDDTDPNAQPSEQQQAPPTAGEGLPQQQQQQQDDSMLGEEDSMMGVPPPPSAMMDEGMGAPPMNDQFLNDEEIEFERLRREDTPAGSDAQRQLLHQQRAAMGLTPGDSAQEELLQHGSRAAGGRSSQKSGSTSSSLGRESENLSAHAGSARRSARGTLRFGTGALEDLLPAINEVDGGGDLMAIMDLGEEAGEEEGPAQATEGTSARRSNPRERSGSRAGTSGDVAAGLSQLLETYGPDTQVQAHAYISRHTQTVISIFRQRLLRNASQLPVGAARDPSVPQEPSLSFFELASQLQRPEAVKLFYQMLVTHTTGFVRAAQDESYGDIKISAGRYL